MKQSIKIELQKAFRNKFTIHILILLLILTVAHVIEKIEAFKYYREYLDSGENTGNPIITVVSVFTNWIGTDVLSIKSNFFYFILPIVATIPFGWSMIDEMNSGYVKNILCKTSRKSYFISKYIAVFVSGAVMIMIPLILNYVLLSMYLPSIKAERAYPYGVVGEPSMWSGIYYEHPLVYIILYILLDAIFAGLLASISTASAFFIKQRLAVILIPFFIVLFLDYLNMAIILISEFSPMKFLRALPTAFDRYGWIIFFEAAIFLISTLGVVLWKEKKYEVL